MLTVLAFVVALGVLIAVHEWGHYRVAVACGVKVLKFSVGFGQPLWRYRPQRQRPGQDTEFVIGAFPLGGYVKMLDEREGPVAAHERHLAFNHQPLWARAAIVAAGPLANLLLAAGLFAMGHWVGMQEPKAILAPPVPGSVADRAGLRGGETVLRAALSGDALQQVRSFEALRWILTQGALDRQDVTLELAPPQGRHGAVATVLLPLSTLTPQDASPELFRTIGLTSPWTQPVMGEITPGSPAERAGLRPGDRVLKVGVEAVTDGQQLRQLIRRSLHDGRPLAQVWQVERAGARLELTVTPELRTEGGQASARIGAYVGQPPEMVTVRYGLLEGAWRGLVRTWELSELTLRSLGRMLVGEMSLKNLSGPLTIADYAGRSASLGLAAYVGFVALISVSLGVLNLLPLPVLDGGHLMYYLWEGVTGKSIPDLWMERLQRGGAAILLLMMGVALFNDVTRIFG